MGSYIDPVFSIQSRPGLVKRYSFKKTRRHVTGMCQVPSSCLTDPNTNSIQMILKKLSKHDQKSPQPVPTSNSAGSHVTWTGTVRELSMREDNCGHRTSVEWPMRTRVRPGVSIRHMLIGPHNDCSIQEPPFSKKKDRKGDMSLTGRGCDSFHLLLTAERASLLDIGRDGRQAPAFVVRISLGV